MINGIAFKEISRTCAGEISLGGINSTMVTYHHSYNQKVVEIHVATTCVEDLFVILKVMREYAIGSIFSDETLEFIHNDIGIMNNLKFNMSAHTEDVDREVTTFFNTVCSVYKEHFEKE